MRTGKIVLALCLILAVLPTANAASTVAGGGSAAQHCQDYTLVRVIGVIDSGTWTACIIFDSEVPNSNTQWVLGARSSGPDNAGGTFTITWSLIYAIGCTIGPLFQHSEASAFGSSSSAHANVTMTSSHCSGLLRGTFTAGSSSLQFDGIFNTDVLQVHECNQDLTGCNQIVYFFDWSGALFFWFIVILAFVFWFAWRKTAHLPYGMGATAMFLISLFNGRFPWTSSTQIGLAVLTFIIIGQLTVELIEIAANRKKLQSGVGK